MKARSTLLFIMLTLLSTFVPAATSHTMNAALVESIIPAAIAEQEPDIAAWLLSCNPRRDKRWLLAVSDALSTLIASRSPAQK